MKNTNYIDKKILPLLPGINLQHYQGVSYKFSDNENCIDLVGDWFLIDASDRTYYHFVFDNVGQYYSLKSLVPNLKLLINLPSKEKLIGYPDYIFWLIDKLTAENNPVILDFENLHHLNIENLYACSTELIKFFRIIDSPEKLTNLVSNDNYQSFVIPHLRNFFLRNLKIKNSFSKIYLSRKNKSKELHIQKEYVNYLKLMNITWNSIPIGTKLTKRESDYNFDPKSISNLHLPEKFQINRLIHGLPSDHEYEVLVRHISEEEEDKLEKYFLSKGYSIISHVDMSYEDQMSAIASASHYATLIGSSALNSIVCREDAHIYILDHNTNWEMPFLNYAPTIISKNAVSIFDFRETPYKKFSVDQIIKKLEEFGV